MSCGAIHWSVGNHQWSQPQEKWLFFLHQLSVSSSSSSGEGASWTPLPFKWAFWPVWVCACSESSGATAMPGPEVWPRVCSESLGGTAMQVQETVFPGALLHPLALTFFLFLYLGMFPESWIERRYLGLNTQQSLSPALWLVMSLYINCCHCKNKASLAIVESSTDLWV